MKYIKIKFVIFLITLIALGCMLSRIADRGFLSSEKINEPVYIRIDRHQQFQTMQGFGGYGAQDVWWHTSPHFDQAFIDMLIDDLGITVLRDAVPFGLFGTTQQNSDASRLDLLNIDLNSRITGDEAAPIEHFNYLKAMHAAGLQKLVVSIWSPPPWMKYNRKLSNGSERTNSAPPYTQQPDTFTNQLKPESYAEFAEFCVVYIKLLKIKTGIDLYAISLQNEPRFSQFYASAVYDPKSLAALIQTVGDRFHQENISTKIFAPEDVNISAYVTPFLNEIIQNPSANQYVTAFAVHDYKADGIRPQSHDLKEWKDLSQIARTAGKEIWMTETSGYDSHSIEGGIALAKSMYNAIKFGNASVWLYWQMSVAKGDALIENGQPTILYYVSKQFYRFIPPGFIRVSATSSDPNLLALAFSSPTDDALTVVLINTSKSSRTVQISENNYLCAQAVTTNNSENYQTLSPNSVSARNLVVSGLSVTSLSGCR